MRTESPDAHRPGTDRPLSVARWHVADLLRGRREVAIVHGDQEYRLRLTRAGKLILTK